MLLKGAKLFGLRIAQSGDRLGVENMIPHASTDAHRVAGQLLEAIAMGEGGT